MQNGRRVTVFDGLTDDHDYALVGQIKELVLTVVGTNQSGQVGTIADVGQLIVSRGEKQTHNRKFSTFYDITDYRRGIGLFESADGGDFKASCIIPFFDKGFEQALNITDDKELDIEFQAADDGTVFSDLKIYVSQREAALPEAYQYYMRGNNVTYGASIAGDVVNLTRPNITELFINDPSDVLTKLQIEQEDGTSISPLTKDEFQAFTNQDGEIEDATYDTVALPLRTPDVIGSTYSKTTVATVDISGAGNLEITACSMEWH